MSTQTHGRTYACCNTCTQLVLVSAQNEVEQDAALASPVTGSRGLHFVIAALIEFNAENIWGIKNSRMIFEYSLQFIRKIADDNARS